jgi:hypothetical protein
MHRAAPPPLLSLHGVVLNQFNPETFLPELPFDTITCELKEVFKERSKLLNSENLLRFRTSGM